MRSFITRRAEFTRKLRDGHYRGGMEAMFLYAAAPVLRKVKPAALITIQAGHRPMWEHSQNALRRATGLQVMEIQRKSGAPLLLIFSEEAVERLTQAADVAELLSEYGYPTGGGAEENLRRLAARFGEAEFPHEIGVFLGYPPEDVKGFIDNGGKNCVCCHYWKVYHNVAKAMEMFRRIDDALSYAMELLSIPLPPHIAATILKAV